MSTASSTTTFDANQLRDWLAVGSLGKSHTRLLFDHEDLLKQPVLAEPVAVALQEALTAGLKLATIDPGRRQIPNTEETFGRLHRLGLTIDDFTRASPGLQTVVTATSARWAQEPALSQRIIQTGKAIYHQRSKRDMVAQMEQSAAGEAYWHLTGLNLGLGQREGFATAALLIDHGLLQPELRNIPIGAEVLKRVSFASTPEEARRSFATSLEHVTNRRTNNAIRYGRYSINDNLIKEVRRLQGEFSPLHDDGRQKESVNPELVIQLWSDFSHTYGAPPPSNQVAFDQLTPAQRVSPVMDAWWGRQFLTYGKSFYETDWSFSKAKVAATDQMVSQPFHAFALQAWDATSLERVVPVVLNTHATAVHASIERYFGKVAVELVDEGSLPHLFERFANHPLPRVRQVAVGIAAERPAIAQDRQWMSWISDFDPGLRQAAVKSIPDGIRETAVRTIMDRHGWYLDPSVSEVPKRFLGSLRDGRLARRIKDDWLASITMKQPLGLGVTPTYGYSSPDMKDAIQLLRSAPDDVVVLSTVAQAFARGARHVSHLHRVTPEKIDFPMNEVPKLINLLPWSDDVRDATRLLAEIRPMDIAPVLMEKGDVPGVLTALARICAANRMASTNVNLQTIGDTTAWFLRRDDRSEHLTAISAALHQGSEDISFIGDYVDSVQAGAEQNRFLTSLRRRKHLKMFLGVAAVLRPGSTPFGMEVTKVAATFMQHPDPEVAEHALAVTFGA